MDENKKDLPISPISEDVIAAMRRASAMTLPDDPSAARMKAGEIRRRFWMPIFGERWSLLSELVRVIGEVNRYLEDLPTGGSGSGGGGSVEDVIRLLQTHDASVEAHGDIRRLIEGLATRLNALANSTDEDLDQMAEVVAYIKANKALIEQVTTSKVSVADIVDNLATNVSNKPLSAAQGVVLKALIDAITVPTKVSELTNDKGYITGYTETDPTVPSWAKATSKPSYTKGEVGLGNVDNVKQYSASNPPPYPVVSVNGKTGAVTLDADAVGARPSSWMPSAADVGARPNTWMPSAADVGARPSTWTPTYSDVGADKSGTASSAVYAHNTATDAHNDLRLLIEGLTTRLNAIANSDDTTLDTFKEVVAYIKANKALIDAITTSKVSVADIVDNLATNVSNKPLSAAQGMALKALIDAITVPTKVSELTNDKGYITGYTETDPTVPSWAKATSKPSYTKGEVGLGNVDNVKQYSASNPPPYPVVSVNGQVGAVTVDVPTKVSELENDKGYLTQHQSLSGYAKTADHYTKTESDGKYQPKGNYLTAVPSEYVTETELNAKKYLTEHQDISGKADKSSAETWTFKLKDGSTVTKKVVLA